MKKKNRLAGVLAAALILPGAAMMLISMTGENPPSARHEGPCDIYKAGGTPCVAAHSTTRALYASYNGPLYQVMRQSDGKTLDIGVVPSSASDPGGYANAAAQDAFCANTLCYITKIYDQSDKKNDLIQAPPGTFKGPAKGGFNNLPIADMAPVTISGHKAYGVYIIPGMGLRNNDAKEIAINDEPEGIYYVINGKHYSSGCCFDYGNSSTNGRAVGTGTMETTYYGTATAWGSGNGSGPWIMVDMEAGLFSGYNAKKNDVPSIDSWNFVSAFVGGGGGNRWDLRGGNAQEGKLTTFYSGVRPGTPNSTDYFPMNKKGGILLGNGGDNGNGSAGTFYEGVMTTGFPTEATTDKVQANVVAVKYDVQRLALSRATSFIPKSVQTITETFTNTTGSAIRNLKLSLLVPYAWSALAEGSNGWVKEFSGQLEPGASVSAIFKVTSSEEMGAGFISGKAEWTNVATTARQSEMIAQRVRNVLPVKINEVSFGSGADMANQFIELYNASGAEIDISNWKIISTASEWAPVTLGTIPSGTKIAAQGFYLLGLSSSGLVAPTKPGDVIINVRSVAGMEIGQQITIDSELCTIKNIGTPSSPISTVFIPVSTGPWLSFPAGTTNLPVTNAAGFVVGEKIGIDLGGNYEIATVTSVGKAATQTNLAVAAKAGDNVIKVAANSNMTVGDQLIISTGAKKEMAIVKQILKVAAAPAPGGFGQPEASTSFGEVELAAPLKFDHMTGVDVSDRGTGISFTPATRFAHKSADALQALGSGITLASKLTQKHEFGAPISGSKNTSGYMGVQKPNQWYGNPFSGTAGSIALKNASGNVLIDAIVYGSQQSSSSANGTVASPEIATLEGNQSQGGCIVVSPNQGRGFPMGAATTQPSKSVGRYPDGNDNDNNCTDFQIQSAVTLLVNADAGATNIKIGNVADFAAGQKIIIGSGENAETVTIASIGTTGGTTIAASMNAISKTILVGSSEGFSAGQTITVDKGTYMEKAIISSIGSGRRRIGAARNATPSDTIKLVRPLDYGHDAGVQVSGSGITFTTPLTKAHASGSPVASGIPTPGETNLYTKKSK